MTNQRRYSVVCSLVIEVSESVADGVLASALQRALIQPDVGLAIRDGIPSRHGVVSVQVDDNNPLVRRSPYGR